MTEIHLQIFIIMMIILKNHYTIVKTIKNKRFGGFTTQNWIRANKYKSDNNAFIFTFDNKEIYYNTKSGYSIYDIIMGSDCMNNNDSWDNSLHSYDTNFFIKNIIYFSFFINIKKIY